MCKKSFCEIYFLVQGFCPLKIIITQFPDGFRLKVWAKLCDVNMQMKPLFHVTGFS